MIAYYRKNDRTLGKVAGENYSSLDDLRFDMEKLLKDDGLAARPIFILIKGSKHVG